MPGADYHQHQQQDDRANGLETGFHGWQAVASTAR